jgi:hypothetical protein
MALWCEQRLDQRGDSSQPNGKVLPLAAHDLVWVGKKCEVTVAAAGA